MVIFQLEGAVLNSETSVDEKDLAIEVGDEPLLLKKIHPDIIVVVEKNRNKAVHKITQEYPSLDVILLDDGFQHRKIKAGLNILLSTYQNPFFLDYVFPMGKLRESKQSKKRTDIFIISKCPNELKENEKINIKKKINPLPNQEIFFSHIKYSNIISLTNTDLIKNYKEYSIILVTGISNPSLIVENIKKTNKNITHLAYKDHYNYKVSDIRKILHKYKKDKSIKKLILTTEKDAVKLIEFKEFLANINIYVLNISTTFEKQKEFNTRILNYVKKNTRNH